MNTKSLILLTVTILSSVSAHARDFRASRNEIACIQKESDTSCSVNSSERAEWASCSREVDVYLNDGSMETFLVTGGGEIQKNPFFLGATFWIPFEAENKGKAGVQNQLKGYPSCKSFDVTNCEERISYAEKKVELLRKVESRSNPGWKSYYRDMLDEAKRSYGLIVRDCNDRKAPAESLASEQ